MSYEHPFYVVRPDFPATHAKIFELQEHTITALREVIEALSVTHGRTLEALFKLTGEQPAEAPPEATSPES